MKRGKAGLPAAPGPTRYPRGPLLSLGPLTGGRAGQPGPWPFPGRACSDLKTSGLKGRLQPLHPTTPRHQASWREPCHTCWAGQGSPELQRPLARPLPPAGCTAPFVAGGETGPKRLCPLRSGRPSGLPRASANREGTDPTLSRTPHLLLGPHHNILGPLWREDPLPSRA